MRGQAGETTKLIGLRPPYSDDVCLIPDMLRTRHIGRFSSVIDALVHAVESYLSPSRHHDELFGKAIEMILEGLRRVSENGSEARLEYLDVFTASCYASMPFAGRLRLGTCPEFSSGRYVSRAPWRVNYLLFGKVLEKYDQIDPDGKLAELSS